MAVLFFFFFLITASYRISKFVKGIYWVGFIYLLEGNRGFNIVFKMMLLIHSPNFLLKREVK